MDATITGCGIEIDPMSPSHLRRIGREVLEEAATPDHGFEETNAGGYKCDTLFSKQSNSKSDVQSGGDNWDKRLHEP